MAAERKTAPLAARSQSDSIPAPIGGLNARDSIANMPITDAVELENWDPKTTSVDLRKGFIDWSTFTGVCQSILVYSGATTTKVFPCVKNAAVYSIYDGTSSGALTVPVVGGAGNTVQALTSTRFDYASFGTTGGQFMTVVNGADVPLQYDGTTWIASTMTGGTPANYFTVAVYKRRLWYAAKNSFDIYYLPVDSITGAATRLHLGPLFKLGGSLNAIITVTDSSNELIDYIGFMSTEGEVVAFTGVDPSSASTWALVAHFRLGRPVIKGNRSWQKWGSDAIVLCADGVYPIRKAIQAGSFSGGLAVSDKIRNLINRDLIAHGGKYGWQLLVHPTGSKLFVNVPTLEDVSAYQYVMNTETGAWTKYTGWTAFCFEIALDQLYFGANGEMVKADVSGADDDAAITAIGRQAFNYFNARGATKQMKMLRPILAADGDFQMALGVDTDYRDNATLAYRNLVGGGGDPWGGIWDVAWSGGMAAFLNWYGVSGVGHSMAPNLNVSANGVSISWSATDAVYETGGVLG
jgi:hypothetical protein